mmetsp:Transcript_22762/g.40943  ORF Transcript_22762/g.40943 Transcript_22762/m.40943 type:complete len:95 (-) Transcript_22762:21-305(-)
MYLSLISPAKIIAALACGSVLALPFLMSRPDKQHFAHERCYDEWKTYEKSKTSGLRERMAIKRKVFYNCFYKAMHTQTKRWVPRFSDIINKPKD